jgi:nucleotide-binding universal stress UspA family protein
VPVGDPTSVGGSGPRGPSASFAAIAGREEDLVAQQARLADLTVVPHAQASDLPSSEALNAVLFDSGRPVLVAPPATPGPIGRRICLAWNGTAESASAITAALPWLARADAVRILAADEYQRRGPASPDLAAYLALHDITAEIATFRPVDKDVGAGLLQAAAAFDADLLAMGAYSHSRLRQLLLGGVTRHVLEHATLPVLMNR